MSCREFQSLMNLVMGCILYRPEPSPWPASEDGYRSLSSYGKPLGLARFLRLILA